MAYIIKQQDIHEIQFLIGNKFCSIKLRYFPTILKLTLIYVVDNDTALIF